MKVLYITSSWFLDGDFPLIRQLRKKGVDVKLCIKVFTHSLTSTVLDLKEQYPKIGIFDSSIYDDSIDKFKKYLGIDDIYVINHTYGENSWRNVSLGYEEDKIIKEFDPDVIHYIGFPSLYEIPLTLKYGRKCIVTVHDPLPHVINIKTKFLRLLRLATIKPISHFLLLNKNQTVEFKSYYHIPTEKIWYSRLGNFDVMKVMGDLSVESDNSILYFGRISPYKGLDYLLPAFTAIQKKYPNVKLVIAGGGKFYFDIDKYKKNPQIQFINRYVSVDELATLVRKCQFVICPYTSATQSGVVASALALAKPVIVTKVGGLPDMIDDGKSGLVIKPCDVADIVSSLDNLLSAPDKVMNMTKFIQQQEKEGENSWEKISNIYIDYYNKI